MSYILARAHPVLKYNTPRVPFKSLSRLSFVNMSVRRILLSGLALVAAAIFAQYVLKQRQDGGATITDWVNPGDKSGEFKRQQSSFRNFISKDPNAEFPAEKGRYHLYISYACPWGKRRL